MHALLIIIGYIIFFLIIYYIHQKHTSNDLDKIAIEIIGAEAIAILTIYYLDKYNIPTVLGIANNIDTKEWFNFIMTFLVTMLGTFISAILVLATTIGQINRAEENEQETHRINNMPFLEYKINIINKDILSDYQNCLAVNEESKITYKLSLDENETIIAIEYQDLLYNIYEQKIDISYTVNKDNKISIDKVIIEDEKLKKKTRS